jgi:hypothetical protein
MTTPGYYNSGRRLKEGDSYLFQVIGKIILQDEKAYFILEDIYKIKHLLPSWYYKNYGINVGQSIKCKVDKINCTGRVYLEPEHPLYSEGNVYDFKFCSFKKNTHSNKWSLILADIFNNEISVDCPKEYTIENKENDRVSCKLIRVRKGKPIVVLSQDNQVKADFHNADIVTSSSG